MNAARALDGTEALNDLVARGRNASIIALVEAVLREAHHLHASDIHLDPTSQSLRLRLRIDGVLIDHCEITKEVHLEIISRIKVLSGLRTDEHQTPQDGRFRHELSDKMHVDVRVSIVPTYHGENAVLRLLTDHRDTESLEALGFSEAGIRQITAAIRKPSGMILATGPTGSGKTTTLYTLIKLLNTPSVSIVTIEDPIEYSIDHIKQIQVNPRTGLSFASGLRSILRQDPDIIMVGEVRDAETAGIAVNTALTGHLLLSTLHTNDAATTLPRLIDMGIDPYLVASTMNLAIGQRLVRKICESCKEQAPITESAAQALASLPFARAFTPDEILWRGTGCEACAHTGYVGRTSLYEILPATEAIKNAIMEKASACRLRTIAIDEGMIPLLEDGAHKVRSGMTTIEEVLRVVHE